VGTRLEEKGGSQRSKDCEANRGSNGSSAVLGVILGHFTGSRGAGLDGTSSAEDRVSTSN